MENDPNRWDRSNPFAGDGPKQEEDTNEYFDEYPNEYPIYTDHTVSTVGGVFFLCWWLFLAYMVITSYKDGTVAYILSYGFLAFGLIVVIYVFSQLICSRFTVARTTITQYFAIRAPRTYDIDAITKVVFRRG